MRMRNMVDYIFDRDGRGKDSAHAQVYFARAPKNQLWARTHFMIITC
jgi:hypothetical protein